MIFGLGTDIVQISRMRAALERQGEGFAARILSVAEMAEFATARDAARLLAKRFAVKEAFGKALGTGVRPPATLHAVALGHDALGKPELCFDTTLASYLAQRQLHGFVSLSDETDYVVAVVILERMVAQT